jgi:hypothetical protein
VSSKPPCRNPYLKAVDYVIHGKQLDSQKTTRFTENYVIHGAPGRDYVGIIIFCVKNYVIHKKLRVSRKTMSFTKNSLMTFSLKEIVPTFVYIHTT